MTTTRATKAESLRVRLDPVFILGYSRSGTTMLRLMLNRHPDLFVPNESEYFQKVPRLYRNKIHKVQDIQWILKTLPDYYNSLLDKSFFTKLLEENLPGRNDILLACLYQACAKSLGKQEGRWGEKKPQNWQFVYRLKQWYPQAQFVHIVRDPRDVISSMEKSLPQNVKLRRFFPYHIILAWQWRYVINELIKQFITLEHDRYYQLKYEDLINSPTEHLTVLCEFLCLKADSIEEMLDFHEDALKPGISDGGAHMKGTREQLNSRSIGSFRKFLSSKQIAEIEFICGEEMKKFGYELENAYPSFLDRIRILLVCNFLTLVWKIVRFGRISVGSL